MALSGNWKIDPSKRSRLRVGTGPRQAPAIEVSRNTQSAAAHTDEVAHLDIDSAETGRGGHIPVSKLKRVFARAIKYND